MPLNKKKLKKIFLTKQSFKIMKFHFSRVKSHQIFVENFFRFFLKFYEQTNYSNILTKFAKKN